MPPRELTLARILLPTDIDDDNRPPAPPSFLRAARALSTPAHPLPLIKQIKFFLRACRHPRKTRAWLARLAQPDLAPAYQAQPRLALKPFLVFINHKWTPAKRRALLDAHYETIPQLIAPEILAQTCRAHHDLLHIINTTTNRRLAIRFLTSDKYEREGDLTLNLTDTATRLTLANLTFSIGKTENETTPAPRIYIGGLQACPDPRVRDIIHDLAREMHGLRAKALLLWTLQQLAARWHVSSIHAIDDAHHITNYRNKHHKVSASYDEFWAESEGTHRADGFWELPVHPRQRPRNELKPNKRRQHDHRYALLATLRQSLQTALDRCAPSNTRNNDPDPVEFFHSNPTPATPPSKPARQLEALQQNQAQRF